MGSREESLLVVDTIEAKVLDGPLLVALASKVACQQVSVKKLDVLIFTCNSKESVQAYDTLVEQSQAMTERVKHISIKGEIGREGWSAVRKAVKHLLENFGHRVYLTSDTKFMGAGKREDLKAIWENIFEWTVEGYGDLVFFNKKFHGEDGWWNGAGGQRRGLEAFINLTEEEWQVECSKWQDDINKRRI